jgi:hypothetical protein
VTAGWGWIIALGIVGLILAVSLSSIPERLIEWRRQFWETDSDGNLPPQDAPPYKMNSFEDDK